MLVKVNKLDYQVNSDEFKLSKHHYQDLSIIDNLGLYERLNSLLIEIFEIGINNIIFNNTTHGGFMPINVSKYFDNVFLINTYKTHYENAIENIKNHNINNISFDLKNIGEKNIIYSENSKNIDFEFIEKYNPIILTEQNVKLINKYKYIYEISNTNFLFYIPEEYNGLFKEQFKFYLKDNILNYDNLINLCIIVKNGGELFEEMLLKNIDVFDRWTILDTGSTDGTIDVIKKILVGKKNGNLYEEPFINFRESRNRCLDLAGLKCKYNLMLDDTYVIEYDLRGFLNEIRGDQFGDSYSLTVKSHDNLEHISNRITKTENKLRYIYTIHEDIQQDNNINVKVPNNRAYISNLNNDYMINRSHSRAEYDLKCLYEMLEEYPDDPRILFYLGQTYKILKNFEKATEYFYKRAFFHNDGFDQEKFESLLEFTLISIYILNKPWREYEKYYKMCVEMQPTFPEGNFNLGIHYFMENDIVTAFKHFKRTFEISCPYHKQYNLNPLISFHFTPYYLSSLCYNFKDYKLGFESTSLFLQHNKPTDNYYNLMLSWYKIYEMLVKLPPIKTMPQIFLKPIFCIVADGVFSKWSGSNILQPVISISETWVIEMARYINRLSKFEVIVFCNCEKEEIFEGVKYIQLARYLQTISEIEIEHCIICNYTEYIPVTIDSHVENIYLILHHLQLSGNVIPIHNKIKNVFCLTEWHKSHFLETFPQFKDITFSLHYGIDHDNDNANKHQLQNTAIEKIYNVLGNPSDREYLIQKNYQLTLKHSWEERANYLLQNFIYKNLPNNIKENITLNLSELDNTPLKTIDKIYFINLSKREDRRTNFLNEIKKHNIPDDKVMRYEAVNGLEYMFTDYELELFKNINYSNMTCKLQIMGNQLSHYNIFLEMIERNYKYIIVCQDDIVFKNGFTDYIDELMEFIPEDAELIYFGFNKYYAKDIVIPWDLNSNDEITDIIVNKMVGKLVPDFNPYYNSNNTTGYILTLNGANNFVKYVTKNGFKYATDCELNDYLINKNIYYCSRQVLATTIYNFGSDIFDNVYNDVSNPYKLTVNNNFLNYLHMYNWTNDLPNDTNAKFTFVKILSNFIKHPSCEILEIGTFVGTSVIGMLQYLPNARATTIDPWMNYEEKILGTDMSNDCLKNMEQNNIEKIFCENIVKSGFIGRITAIKGDSAFELIQLIKKNRKFDFIYVDGSHKAIDCYADCLLSWELLNENGILGIDDYLYKISFTNEFDNVMKVADHFLEKIKGQFILLENGYRIFIKKVITNLT